MIFSQIGRNGIIQVEDLTNDKGGIMAVLNVNIERAGYDDQQNAIQDLSFSILPGQLIGLIGPNGAGKSTTIKAILRLLKNVKGKVQIAKSSTNVAYIPERPVLYDGLTLWEHIEFAATVKGMERPYFERRALELLERFQLEKVKHQFPDHFSKGMQQKVMIIMGFLMPVDLYIVDEPFIGLDPKAVKVLMELLEEVKSQEAAILMSTHVLDTAEKICDGFLLLHEGRLLAQGPLRKIREESNLPDGSLFDCFIALLEAAK